MFFDKTFNSGCDYHKRFTEITETKIHKRYNFLKINY